MFTIVIEIDDQELEVQFQKFIKKDSVQWIADCYIPDEIITIQEIEGIPDEKTLIISNGISTPAPVVFERFLISFNNYQQEISSGFEPSQENINQVIEPQPYNPDDIKV